MIHNSANIQIFSHRPCPFSIIDSVSCLQCNAMLGTGQGRVEGIWILLWLDPGIELLSWGIFYMCYSGHVLSMKPILSIQCLAMADSCAHTTTVTN